MKPIIGVTPDFNAGDRKDMGGKEPTYFLRARYPRAIEAVGGVPVILPFTDDPEARRQLLKGLDGLLLTGSGPDLPPRLYGERQRFAYRVMSRERSEFELEMARLAVKSGMPVLGICGGMQAINVALGGSLVQDIDAQVPAALPHRAPGPATKPAHVIQVSPRSLLHRITKAVRIRVNSSHHQSVKRLAPSLVASAVAPDGVIEALEAEDPSRHPFLLGVQWHPEFLYDRDAVQRRLFLAFLKAARHSTQ
ncbi:MAG TPA: gamma-glutamyl-gamma-aminobutyrate hydrolase family protein [Nitrospiraceae bacterium]|jgi:putative glutamine amidotransferase|nr:gamma-glutamyl-gamma-aminobutyrate hydrolase family protein [Nitrospiraceae bacterium]